MQKPLTFEDLVGSWKPVSVRNLRPDGSVVLPFGAAPQGILMLQRSERFAFILNRPDLPAFASGDRFSGTAEENRAIVHGSFAYFGTWALEGHVVMMQVDGGTWPGWIGSRLHREVVALEGDELRWRDPTPSIGGVIENVWRRLDPVAD